MNILITGGAGFIGRALTKRLAADGHSIAVVDCRAPPGATAWLGADIAAPGARLDDFFSAHRPEAVIHLAARASVAESLTDPLRGAAVNVCGTVSLLERSRAFGVRRFIFASSGGALYGDAAPRPTPETVPPQPLSPYGASKAAAEEYVRTLCRLGGMRYAILRLGNVYGPGRGSIGEAGVVRAFARAMLAEQRPVIYGDGLSERDYVHVDDAVEAHRLALGLGGDGVFNIASGTARTVREVFEAVARAAGYRRKPAYAPARPGELRHSCLDVAQAGRALGWRTRTPFECGVAATVDWMRATAAPDTMAAPGQ